MRNHEENKVHYNFNFISGLIKIIYIKKHLTFSDITIKAQHLKVPHQAQNSIVCGCCCSVILKMFHLSIEEVRLPKLN